jgi:DNA-directed RNA polymerase specialized sigma24 family protein
MEVARLSRGSLRAAAWASESEGTCGSAAMSDQPEHEKFRTLLRQAQAGSPDAARELYDTYVHYIRKCVRLRLWRKLRSKFDSQDFVQQVWLSFFRDGGSLPDFQSPAELLGYFKSMAEHKVTLEARNRQMKRRTIHREERVAEEESHVGNHPATRIPTPSAIAIVRERYDELVGQRPREMQDVAEMRLAGATFRQIAEELQIDEATARRVMRVLRRRSSLPPQMSPPQQSPPRGVPGVER